MSLDEAGIEPPLRTWIHIAALTTETALSLFIGQRRVDFEKRAAFPQAMTIEINPAHLRPVIPGFPDLIPDFETKKPDFQHITAREHNRNITLPFTLRRPVVVAEYSQTTRIAAHTAFVVQTPGVTLTLGIGGFVGCEVRVFNSASGAATVVYGEGASATLKQDGIIRFEWQGGRWKRRMLAAEDTPDGSGAYREGRNLLDVLEVTAIPDAIAVLKARCNNGGSAANGEPDFAGLHIGDYLDGLDLSAIPAAKHGTIPPRTIG